MATPTVSDSSMMALLTRELTRAVQRSAVAASNLANAETPGYRTKEITFGEELEGQLGRLQTSVTHARHLGAAAAAGTVREAEGLAERRDGNNVQMERELLALGRAGTDFASAQTVLSAKFRLVRYAISEGR